MGRGEGGAILGLFQDETWLELGRVEMICEPAQSIANSCVVPCAGSARG